MTFPFFRRCTKKALAFKILGKKGYVTYRLVTCRNWPNSMRRQACSTDHPRVPDKYARQVLVAACLCPVAAASRRAHLSCLAMETRATSNENLCFLVSKFDIGKICNTSNFYS